jgi:hypothetical protein
VRNFVAKKNRNQRPQAKTFRWRWRYQVVGERKTKQTPSIRNGEKLWSYAKQAVLYWIDPRRTRYDNETLRRLTAERGSGSVRKVHPRLRQSWSPTKR